MDLKGLSLCTRFSFPPNNLTLCGPDKQNDLKWYGINQTSDKGTKEILEDFSTLYPYLKFIAGENNIKDIFDHRVVEAYWLGNQLLENKNFFRYKQLISDSLNLRKKIPKRALDALFIKTSLDFYPHHSFHVINIYRRTGNLNANHTLKTIDSCIINWGQIIQISKQSLLIQTRPLTINNEKLQFGKAINRSISILDQKDISYYNLQIGDWVSYHWGMFCQKLSARQLKNLQVYTLKSFQHFTTIK